jgi:hypothetical protein
VPGKRLPTVTFLFTDVEGSVAQVWSEHRRPVRVIRIVSRAERDQTHSASGAGLQCLDTLCQEPDTEAEPQGDLDPPVVRRHPVSQPRQQTCRCPRNRDRKEERHPGNHEGDDEDDQGRDALLSEGEPATGYQRQGRDVQREGGHVRGHAPTPSTNARPTVGGFGSGSGVFGFGGFNSARNPAAVFGGEFSEGLFKRVAVAAVASRADKQRDALHAVTALFMRGYIAEMNTRPQTIGYGSGDPVGMAAWMLDHDTDSYERSRARSSTVSRLAA